MLIAGLGMTQLKIRIEFALFEWMTWYQSNMPGMPVLSVVFKCQTIFVFRKLFFRCFTKDHLAESLRQSRKERENLTKYENRVASFTNDLK